GRAAVATDSQIAHETAAGHRGDSPNNVDRAAEGAAAGSLRGDRLVVEEDAVRDGKGAAVRNGDGPSSGEVAEGFIIGQQVVGDGHRAAGVQEAAAPAIPPGPAVGDRQPGDGHGEPFGDVEDPVDVLAADGQQVRSGPLDVQALVDRQLVAGQGDGLA